MSDAQVLLGVVTVQWAILGYIGSGAWSRWRARRREQRFCQRFGVPPLLGPGSGGRVENARGYVIRIWEDQSDLRWRTLLIEPGRGDEPQLSAFDSREEAMTYSLGVMRRTSPPRAEAGAAR